MNDVLFAPHSDDETLFAAFTLIRHRPRVVVCVASERDYGDNHVRMEETRAAERILRGESSAVAWHAKNLEDLVQAMQRLDRSSHPTRVWAPDRETSHPQHEVVAIASEEVFGDRLTTYHTYVDGAKVRSGHEVPYEPAWLELKLRALACYRSQIQHPRAHRFFADDLREYYGSVR